MDFEIISAEEFKQANRLTLPPKSARAGWEFDTDEINEALDYLEIHLPVRIRFTAGKYYRVGCHYARDGWHRVTLSQDKGLVDSNNTLWHELTHASQSEKFARETGKPTTKFYRESYKPARGEWGASYKGNKFEIHAEQIAERWEVNWPLLREAT